VNSQDSFNLGQVEKYPNFAAFYTVLIDS